MRAVVLLVLSLVGMSGSGRGSPRAVGLPREPSCEEQCQQASAVQAAACDDRLRDADRPLCREAVLAQLAVCMRLCDE